MRRSAIRQAVASLITAVSTTAYQRQAGGTEALRHAKMTGDTGYQFDHLTFVVELGDTQVNERKRTSSAMAVTSIEVTVTHQIRRALDGSIWTSIDAANDLAEDIAEALSVTVAGATFRVDSIRPLGATLDDTAWGMVLGLVAIHSIDLGS